MPHVSHGAVRTVLVALAGAAALAFSAVPVGTYTVILIPDTQNYTGKQDKPKGTDQTYSKMTHWIREQSGTRNIVAAIHLGDLTNSNGNAASVSQWSVARAAHDTLDLTGIAYSVIPGNHDHREVETSPTVLSREVTQYAAAFGPARFADRPWYLATHPFDDPSNANSAITFSVGSWKFLGIALDFTPTKNAVCWAAEQIRAHPDRRVLVSTHSYLDMGRLNPDGTTRELRYDSTAAAYNIVGLDGGDLWDELISRHSNIQIAASGHVQGGAMYAPRGSPAGSTVHQILTDYQDEYRNGEKQGQGWLKVLEITPATGEVRAYPFSVLGETAFNAEAKSNVCTGERPCYRALASAWDHTFDFSLPTTLPPDMHLAPDAFTDQTVNVLATRTQRRAAAALGPSGDLVVAWEDDSDGPQDVYEIVARRFAADGCGQPAQFNVNVESTRQQLRPAIATAATGNSIYVWEDDSHGASGVYQIYARGLAADGHQTIPTFTVNTVATGSQRTPRVAAASDGSFAVVWRDERTATPKVYLRVFDAAGNEILAERRVDPGSSAAETDPSVAMSDAHDVVVTWSAGGNVHAAGFRPGGSGGFARLSVPASSGGWKGRSDVASVTGAGFAVTWEQCVGSSQVASEATACGSHPRTVMTRLFPTASAPSAQVLASAANVHGAAYPRIGADAAGRFMVVWQDDADGNKSFEVVRRAFGSTGTPIDPAPLTVNKNPRGNQTAPAIAVRTTTGGVRWVIAWTDDLDRNGWTQILARGGKF